MRNCKLPVRPEAFAALMLCLMLSAWDTGSAAETATDELREAMQKYLDTPQRSAGAHKQDDPHAALRADQLAQVALRHFDEGRAQLAMDTLNSAIAKYPQNSMLLSLRSSLFLQQSQTSLALADLNRAVELNPHDPILLTNRAQALRQFGRDDDARRDLDGAIELNPDFIAAYFNRGSLHFEAEQYDLALVDFNRCIELAPEVPAAYFNRASTFEALGERSSAIKDLQFFISLKPEVSWVEAAKDILKQWQSENS